MRIGLVVERFEPGLGGVENEAWQVARGLAAAGDEVLVIARRGRPAPGVELHRVAVPAAWQPLRVLAFSRAAARQARRTRCDVMYSLSRTAQQDVLGAAGGSHADYLERCHAGLARQLRRLSPRHRALLELEGRALRDARQRVVCNSQMVRDQLARRYAPAPGRLVVIRNGVDLDRFHPGRRARFRAPLRAELGAGSGPVWLFPGSGFARKGLDTALRAFAAGGPRGACLWVAGADRPTPWRSLAERLGVAGRVRFLGFRRDVPELLAAADAVLLPSRYDACASACLEAAAAGLPVVTSGANGAAELFGAAGLTVADPEDGAAFAAALDRLADAGERERLGRLARAAVEPFGWPTHVSALRKLFAEFRN